MNRMKGAKEIYDSIEIPGELSQRVRLAVDEAALIPRSRRWKWYQSVICTAACACLIFVISLNAAPAFAAQIYDIPVLGNIAKVFTFREFTLEDEEKYIEVRMPAIENTANTQLEERINYEIRHKIDGILKEQEIRAKEYRQAFLETGGKEEDFHKILINIDYKVTCSNDQILSFVITKSETLANAYQEQFYYNIDLKTGRDISLSDMLGPDYRLLADEVIRTQIVERMEQDDNALYFGYGDDGMTQSRFSGIDGEQTFFINEQGNVVITFEKYAIAPGYMGIQEFEIPTNLVPAG